MPKLRTLSGAQARAILEAQGFQLVRQKGSHIMLELQESSGTRLMPIPNHKTLTRGTLSSVIRLSSLSRSLFETANIPTCKPNSLSIQQLISLSHDLQSESMLINCPYPSLLSTGSQLTIYRMKAPGKIGVALQFWHPIIEAFHPPLL